MDAAALPLVSADEVARHSRLDDLWLVVDGVVYDVTAFAPRHPGGTAVLLRCAGADASRAYHRVHGPGLIAAELPPACHVGRLDPASVTAQWRAAAVVAAAEADDAAGDAAGDQGHPERRPPLAEILSLHDFAAAAEAALPPQAWAFLSAGTEDGLARDANQAVLRRIGLRPRVLRGVAAPRLRLGTALFAGRCPLPAMPVLVAPTGSSRTAGDGGERVLARAAAAAGIIPVISTVASYPYEAILAELPDDGRAFFQLYVDADHARTEALLRRLLAGPQGHKVRAVFVTVDLPVSSKREADERGRIRAARRRAGADHDHDDNHDGDEAAAAGIARQTSAFLDAGLCWDDLPWLRRTIDAAVAANPRHPYAPAAGSPRPPVDPLPLVLKGLQRADDVQRAVASGCCQGVVLSNHGGRAADTAPPAVLTLLELHRTCPEVFSAAAAASTTASTTTTAGRFEIFVDGGFRRGSDVVKALCLGASAVAVGRPFVFALGYGPRGVARAAALLRDEIQTTMQLCGLVDLVRDASPDLVHTADVDHLVPAGPHHPYARKVARPAKL